MKLKVLLPTEVFLEEDVNKITAEGQNGFFTLLPRHIDFVSALVPGILYFQSLAKEEKFIAINRGILVKCGQDIMVSCRQAVAGDNLRTLEKIVRQEFLILDEQEKKARSASARLEAGIIRRFIQWEKLS